MSATLYWRPTVRGRVVVKTDAPSRLQEILREVTEGRFLPVTLHKSLHLPTLRALAAANPEEEAWSQIVEALEEHDSIEITAEH